MNNFTTVRPVTPALVPQWLELQAEYIEKAGNVAEQAARVRGAIAATQRLIDAPVGTYASEDFRDARIELNWAVHRRDEALENASFVE